MNMSAAASVVVAACFQIVCCRQDAIGIHVLCGQFVLADLERGLSLKLLSICSDAT